MPNFCCLPPGLRWRVALAVTLVLALLTGCGGGSAPDMTPPAAEVTPAQTRALPPAEPAAQVEPAVQPSSTMPAATVPTANVAPTPTAMPVAEQEPTAPPPPKWTLPPLDEARLKALGIRVYRGQHLVLCTDVADEQVRDLPALFDAAVSVWQRYFGKAAEPTQPFQIRAHLVRNRALFQAAGLWRAELPEFRFGFAFPDAVWMSEQGVSDYFRQHLLLHEGLHAFMFQQFQHCGPPWYMEGMAELLATHRWKEGRLELAVFPAEQAEVPRLGRIFAVQTAVRAGRAWELGEVLSVATPANSPPEPYAWCWALTELLEHHPRYRDRFRELSQRLADKDFTAQFVQRLGADYPLLNAEWQVYCHQLEHGYDFSRNAIDFQPGEPPGPQPVTTQISAERGWQSSGWQVQQGKQYRLSARGRYQVAQQLNGQPQVWWCEPNGISFRYHQGRPLGVLLAAVVPDQLGPHEKTPLVRPLTVGTELTFTAAQTGTLYFQLNEHPAEWADNRGDLAVTLEALQRAP